jgi:hypothetical protein
MTGATRMTRRALLAATAGALAGPLLRPGGTLASLLPPAQPIISERRLGALPAAGATIELANSADLVGLEWRGPAEVGVWLRFRGAGGRWSAWAAAGQHGHGPDDAPSPTGRQVGDPLWTGGTTSVQIRSTRALDDVRLHLIDVSAGVGARRQAAMASPLAMAAALPLASPVLAAGAGQPPIIARRAWARGMAPPRVAPAYGAVRLAFVHHTENPNGYAPGEVPAMLRAIYTFHRYVNGWNDIGYNFVLDSYGRIFEARAGGIDEPVTGAHAGGYNLASTGVAVLGSFTAAPISPAARGSLQRLLAWKLALHGAPAVGMVTVRVNPAGPDTAAFRPTPACPCRGLPATATGTPRTAPATPSTASWERSEGGCWSLPGAPRAPRSPSWPRQPPLPARDRPPPRERRPAPPPPRRSARCPPGRGR